MKCPRCQAEAQKVGQFWICPKHGQSTHKMERKRASEAGKRTANAKRQKPKIGIFLSYGHDDNKWLVGQLKSDLEKCGYVVWFDEEIRTSRDWRREITEAISRHDRFLAFLSVHSMRVSGVCLDEIGIAFSEKSGNIHTVLVEPEEQVKPPPSISCIQYLDMHDWRAQKDSGEKVWKVWYGKRLSEIVTLLGSDESYQFHGEIARLKGFLKPITSHAQLGQLLKNPLVGREWLRKEIDIWAKGRQSRFFWITAGPGAGKSAIAADLAHVHPAKVIAVQFCQWNSSDHREPLQIIRNLAFQIATRLPDYRTVLLEWLRKNDLDGKNADALFDCLLAERLKCSIDGGRERYLIIIDALDEAGADGRNAFVEMLARKAEALPEWIGIVVTSRPESNVIDPMQGVEPFRLDTTSQHNLDDIRGYLRDRLKEPLQKRPDTDTLVERILEKSEGLFLYVELFCNDIQHNRLSLDRPFPQGLGGIYFQYFQRQFSQVNENGKCIPDLEKYEKDIEPVLGAILAAFEPLPVTILGQLFDWGERTLNKWLRVLGSLFPVTSEFGHKVIKPYHKSLVDWLVDEGKAGLYFVSSTEGHRILAETFSKRLKRTASMHQGSPDADYLTRYGARHCLALGQRTEDFALLYTTITREHIFRLENEGNSVQAYKDNACRLVAMQEAQGKEDLAAHSSHSRPAEVFETTLRTTRAINTVCICSPFVTYGAFEWLANLLSRRGAALYLLTSDHEANTSCILKAAELWRARVGGPFVSKSLRSLHKKYYLFMEQNLPQKGFDLPQLVELNKVKPSAVKHAYVYFGSGNFTSSQVSTEGSQREILTQFRDNPAPIRKLIDFLELWHHPQSSPATLYGLGHMSA